MITKTYSIGTYDRYGASRGYVLELILTEEAVDAVTNTSSVSYRLQLRSGGGNRFDWELTSTLSLNGTQVAAKTEEKYLDYHSLWVLLSGQTTVRHEADGTAQLAFSARVTPWDGGNTYTPPELTLSGTMALTDIPRASTLAATSVCIGDAATVAVSRKSAGFTHSIHYRFGTLSGYLADSAGTLSDTEEKLTATTLVFPIPESFYGQIPDAPSGTCTLTCTTYSGAVQIGDVQTAQFTVTADPARCGPLVTAQAEDTNEQTLALTGDGHIIVAGKSRVACVITAQPRHGAAIGAIYINGAAAGAGTNLLENIPSAQITVRAVDTRGYFAEYTVPGLQLVEYVPLGFHAAASRTDPTSGNGLLQVAGKWFSGSFGAAENALTAQYRVDGGDWQSFSPDTDGGDITAQVDLSGLDYRTGHSIEVTLSDRLETLKRTATVHKGIPVFDWGENDFCFHVPVVFTATDGTKFTLTFQDGQLKGEKYE